MGGVSDLDVVVVDQERGLLEPGLPAIGADVLLYFQTALAGKRWGFEGRLLLLALGAGDLLRHQKRIVSSPGAGPDWRGAARGGI